MTLYRPKPMASYFAVDCTGREAVDQCFTDNAVDLRFLFGLEGKKIASPEIIL